MIKQTGQIALLVNGLKAPTHKITKDVSNVKQERHSESRSKAIKQAISNR